MPSISIGQTDKKVNSTKTTYTAAVSNLSVTLKEPCSMRAPVFEISRTNFPTAGYYNYLQWGSYYYYIKDITYLTNGVVRIETSLDVLATFSTDIKNAYGFCIYGDSTHHTPYIDDTRFGPDHKIDWDPQSGDLPHGYTTMGLDKTNGSVVMTVQTSKDFSSYSGVITYAMSPAVFRRVLRGFSGVVNSDIAAWSTTDVLDILRNYAKRLLTGGQQALDNILSAVYVPVPLTKFATIALDTINYIGIGPYEVMLDSGDTVHIIMPDATIENNYQIKLGRPLPNTTLKWLNSPKYCSVKLTHPCGYQEINDPSLMEMSYVYLWWAINYASGEYTIRVTSENKKDSDTIAVLNGNVGIDVLSWKPSPNQTIDAGLHDKLLGQLLPGVYNAGTNGPATSGKSLGAGFTGLTLMKDNGDIFYDVEYYQPAIFEGNSATAYNAYCDRYGYPVGQYLKLGDIDGYLVARDVSIDAAQATDEDKRYINSIINSGIYIE